MSTTRPKQNYRGYCTPAHLRSPEFAEYLRQAAARGGRSRSLAKLDAARKNGIKGGEAIRAKRKGVPRGPNYGHRVPPLNTLEVSCVGLCGFSMMLSAAAMEASSRGRLVVWTCPDCGCATNRVEPRTCPAPVMPPRPPPSRNG